MCEGHQREHFTRKYCDRIEQELLNLFGYHSTPLLKYFMLKSIHDIVYRCGMEGIEIGSKLNSFPMPEPPRLK